MDHSATVHAQRFDEPPAPPLRHSNRNSKSNSSRQPQQQQLGYNQRQLQLQLEQEEHSRREAAEKHRWSQWQVLEEENQQQDAAQEQETEQLQHLHSEALAVRQIWGDLASLVADQSEKLDTASSQATATSQKVQDGVHELAQAAKYRTKKYAWNTAVGTGLTSGVAGAVAMGVASG